MLSDIRCSEDEYQLYNTISYCECLVDNIKCVAIYGMFVHPSMRKRGIATMLLQEAVKEIKAKYHDVRIVAEVEPFGQEWEEKMDSEALKVFYSKHGVDEI